MKPFTLGVLLFFLLCLALASAIGQGEEDGSTILRPTHPNPEASTHAASSDPNHYATGHGNFAQRTFPVYDKESAKINRLQHEASLYREALKSVGSDGTVMIKAPAQEIEAKLSKIERKLLEKEGKKRVKGFTFSYKTADPETRSQFDEYYRQALEQNHQSACLAFYDLKNKERLEGYLSLADRTKMKIDQVRCKVEKSELFQKFMGGNNPASQPNGDGGYHENAPDAERTTSHVITKTSRRVIKKP